MKLRCIHVLAIVATALLTGCASVREVQSTVQSYSTLGALPAPPTYRLEVLPSQREAQTHFAAIESQAQQALGRVGLQRDDSPGQPDRADRCRRSLCARLRRLALLRPLGRPALGLGPGLRARLGHGLWRQLHVRRPAAGVLPRRQHRDAQRHHAADRLRDLGPAPGCVDRRPGHLRHPVRRCAHRLPNPPKGSRVVRTTIGPVQQGGAPAQPPAQGHLQRRPCRPRQHPPGKPSRA